MEIVAEFSYNHLGNTDRARQMIVAAKNSGATCVKFEMRNNSAYFRNYPAIKENKQQFEFNDEILKGFISDCNKVGIPWFASVHDFYSLKKILPFGPKYIKVASREARIGSFLACVKELTEGRVPIIISTGGLLFEQIEQIYNQMSRGHLTLVHTSCLYPCGIENLNMNRVRMMKDKFDCNIGYSGHEQGFLPTLYATALGVNYIERHFTLEDRQKKVAKGKEGFQDDLCTLGPETFAEMVNGVRLFMQLIKQNTDKGNLPLELERVNAYGIPDWDGHDVFVR